METKDILHLARLARIRISNEEAQALTTDIESVLSYVSQVDSIAADSTLTKKVGVRFNVFREDEVTVEPGAYTKAMLVAAPSVQGDHLRVKKILQQD